MKTMGESPVLRIISSESEKFSFRLGTELPVYIGTGPFFCLENTEATLAENVGFKGQENFYRRAPSLKLRPECRQGGSMNVLAKKTSLSGTGQGNRTGPFCPGVRVQCISVDPKESRSTFRHQSSTVIRAPMRLSMLVIPSPRRYCSIPSMISKVARGLIKFAVPT